MNRDPCSVRSRPRWQLFALVPRRKPRPPWLRKLSAEPLEPRLLLASPELSDGLDLTPAWPGGAPSAAAKGGSGTEIQDVSQNATTLGQYEKFEASFQLSASYANPFDPDEVDVTMTVTQPDQSQVTVPAFYTMEFDAQTVSGRELYVNGRNAGWQARFAPAQIGEHTFSLRATDGQGTVTLDAAGSFVCLDSEAPGFVRVDPRDSRYFVTEGTDAQFIPLGQNIAWDDDTGLAAWETHFDALAGHGGNWARVWMTDFYVGTSIEWSRTHWTGYYDGVGQYSLEHAWKLDRLLELAEARHLGVQLVLQHHGQFSTSVDPAWSKNPYNDDNEADGGFLATPQEFFSNAQARELFQQKLRYLVARWGYSTSLFAWEFFNEVNFTDGFRSDLAQREVVSQWHREMSAWLAANDPYDHLRTTSGERPAGEPSLTGSDPNMDVIQVHAYDEPSKIEKFRRDTQTLSVHGKPVMFGEFGAGKDPGFAYHPEENPTGYPALQQSQIAEGLVLHNGIWSASHLASSAGLWWWDYVLDNGLHTHFQLLHDYWAGETPGAWDLVTATLDRVHLSGGPVVSGLTLAATRQVFDGPPVQTVFTVERDGSVEGLENLNQYVHGTWKESWRSDPTFVISLVREDDLILHVKQVSDYGTNSLQVLVDGVVVATFDGLTGRDDFTLTARIPAGQHDVQIKDTGQDWVLITGYEFRGFEAPVTRSLGQIADDRAYLWFYDVDSEYRRVAHGILSGVTASLQGWTDGAYVVEYWNTRDPGGLRSSAVLTASGGTLTLALPDFACDMAVKVRPLPAVSVSVSPESVAEDSPGRLTYTFTRNGPVGNPATVTFRVTGTATFPSDYAVSGAASFDAQAGTGTVTFAADSATAAVTLDPSADDAVEEDETACLEVLPGVDYAVGSPAQATGIIANDDTATLIVTEFVPTQTGFVARFGRDLEPSVLNLYDSASQTLGAADATVTGATHGVVRGSLVVSADLRQITFVQTGGLLEPDTYTVTLFSGATRFREPSGETLDGNADGTTGDDYQTAFTVSARPAGTVTVSLPDLARGAGQPVNVPNAAAGVPIRVDNAEGVRSLAVDMTYDPALLAITAAALAADLPGDWSIALDTGTPGVAKITASGTTPLSGTNVDVVRLTAAVPGDAPYGAVQAIRLENVSLSGGTVAAVGDVAVHKAVYLGDADGSGMHSSADAFLTVQAALGSASGFAAHSWTDPLLVGDADGSGVLSAADAFLIVQEGLGLAELFVPDNPHIGVTPIGGGVDPQFQIDENLAASAGGLVSVPVKLAIEEEAINVGAIDFDLFFDPSQLTIQLPEGVSAGADTPGWAVTAKLKAAGHLRVGMVSSSGQPLTVGLREVARVQFSVEPSRMGLRPVPDESETHVTLLPPITDHRLPTTDLSDGSETHPTSLDIEPVDARAGGYTWTDADGSVLIRGTVRGPAAAARERVWRDLDARADLLDSLLVDLVHEIASAWR